MVGSARASLSSLRQSVDWRRLGAAATGAIQLAIAASWIWLSDQVLAEWGNDFEFFVAVAQRWQATGDLYGLEQLSGPYQAMTGVSVLYPPIVLYLFVPFTVLPGFLWWVIPLGILGWHLFTARPAWWAWPVIALCLFAPRSQAIIIWGNTGMWIAAIVALGLRFAWASPFVLLKPTFLPFALIGVRRWAWWVGLAFLLVASLAMLPLWFDYVAAMRNNVGEWPPGFLYSLPDYILVAIPVVAWIARNDGRRQRVAVATIEPGLDVSSDR
jgi:hypothetical protein